MAEYIDRGKLVEFLKQVRRDLPHDSKDFFTRDEMILNFQQFVESKSFVPSEDVEPVVHAKWVFDEDSSSEEEKCYRCSNCKAILEEDYKWHVHNYCYHCGAKMEEYKSDIT